MNDFSTLITNLGFPIACAVALGYFIFQQTKTQREDNNKREDRLLTNNEKLSDALNKSSQAIVESTKVISVINDKVDDIDSKVDKVLDAVNK